MKKTLVSILLVMVLLSTMIAPAFAWEIYYSKCPNGKPLNVRRAPSKESEKLGSYAYGEAIHVESISNGWAAIIYGSVGTAYVQASLISKTYPGTKPSTPSSSGANYKSFVSTNYQAVVTPARATSGVSVYWTPSTSGVKMETLYNDDPIVVLAQTNTWVQIYDEANGVAGFMLKKYITKVK